MTDQPTPNGKAYWDVPVEDLTSNLPAERVIIPNGSDGIVVCETEGFRGLIRGAMSSDFDAMRKSDPGRIYVTRHRGSPLINVTATTGEKPEVVWVKKFIDGNKKIAGAKLARMIAETQGKGSLSRDELIEFCMTHLHGKSVLDRNGLLRIVENDEYPPAEERLNTGLVKFDSEGGTADNSVGVAYLV